MGGADWNVRSAIECCGIGHDTGQDGEQDRTQQGTGKNPAGGLKSGSHNGSSSGVGSSVGPQWVQKVHEQEEKALEKLGRQHQISSRVKPCSTRPHVVLTLDSQRGRGPLLSTHTQVLPRICRNQATDLQFTHRSILLQAVLVPISQGLCPLPPFHGGLFGQLTPQCGRGPFCGLLVPQFSYELGSRGCSRYRDKRPPYSPVLR